MLKVSKAAELAAAGLHGLFHGPGELEGRSIDVGDYGRVGGDAGLACVAGVAGGYEVAGLVAAAERRWHHVVNGELHVGCLGTAVSARVAIPAQDLEAQTS